MPTDTDARLAELELRSMAQTELVQQLSEALYTQQRQLDRLQARFDQLTRRVDANPGQVDAAADEKPPHY
jgi:SlyX protein